MRARALALATAVVLGSVLVAPSATADPALGGGLLGRQEQSISMDAIPPTSVDRAVAVSAYATSLLPVEISLSGACTWRQLLGGRVVVATDVGECVVTADQPGDRFWLPAPTVQQRFMFVSAGAGVHVSIDGTGWLLAAQGTPLDVRVVVASDDPAGLTPTGSVRVRMDPLPGGPACPACQPVAAVLDSTGRATVRIPGEATSAMPAGGYVVTADYDGDRRYATGSVAAPTAKVVPPGPVVPGSAPIVVSVGDSYISGQGGRWAGNALNSATFARTDVGADTYLDAGSREAIDGCHRAKYSEIHIEQAGAGVASVNLSCGGAETATRMKDGRFKPGIDYWQDEGAGWRGQALELYRLAAANPGRVRMVALSIGGNDFQFEDVVKTCVTQFLTPGGKPCVELDRVRALFEEPSVGRHQADITTAIRNLASAMASAGYDPSQWGLVVQGYPSPVPDDGSLVRYRQGYERQLVGGCGMFDKDMAYANTLALRTINDTVRRALDTSGVSNGHYMDLTNALVGHRLCEKGVGLVGPTREVKRWTDANALDGSEWVTAIRVESMIADGPYDIGESLHPNYWGGLANQVCLKLAYNDGQVRGGSCVQAGGAYPNLDGDNRVYPVMSLVGP